MKYTGLKTEYEVNFSRLSPHVVQLLGDFPVKARGFSLSREGKEDNWDYSGYTTIYREVEGGIQYSDDGSVYVAPVSPPEPDPYIPTEEELAEQARQQEIAELAERIAEIDSWFAVNDYIGIKIATGRATVEEYAETIAQMDVYAAEKSILQKSIEEMRAKAS